MVKVKSSVKIYTPRVKAIDKASVKALEMAAEALHTDVKQAQVMPYDLGTMQNTQTFVDASRSSRGIVSLVVNTKYARRLYFHPEYHFRKTENPNAQGRWLEWWINGNKKAFCRDAYAQFLSQNGGIR